MTPGPILIIGKIGQVGYELRRTLAPAGEVMAVDFPEIDLTDPDSTRKIIREAAPAVIINAAAYTAVDKAESEPERCHLINGVAPGIIAQEAARLGALLAHYSTDYVFDGAKGAPYTEEDAPNPLGAYGRSKLAGDLAVQASGCNHLIFRLCWVYGARGQNFLLTIMRLAKERERLRVVADQVGCPTWSRLIAQASAFALAQVIRSEKPAAFNGIYNLAASGQTSWQGFASSIVALMPAESRKCQAVDPITTPEYPLPARRPPSSVLSCEKLKRTFGLRLPDWRESLQMVLEP